MTPYWASFRYSVRRAQPQALRGQRFVASCGLEHLEDVALLDLFERHELAQVVARNDDVSRFEAPYPFGEIVDGDVIESRERDRSLDGVPELAHVAGPG